MKPAILAILLTLATVSTAADGNHRSKMTPFVRMAAQGQFAGKRLAPNAGRPMICAFVEADQDGAAEALAANECRVLDCQGDIYIVVMPTDRLNSLAACRSVRRIEASRPRQIDLDTTAVIVGATRIRAAEALPQAFDGSGVTVGVMDIGFDLTHPTFYDRDMDTYRIGAIWDMLSPDTVGSRLPVGRDYVGRETVCGLQHSTDGNLQTHGTHTLGIAAGSGYDSEYRGIAPASDICLVSNVVSDNMDLIAEEDLYKYTSALDALGFKYIFDYADQQGQPCVASLSEGSVPFYDNEDSLYSAYLSQLVGPGHIIVASAGNEGVRRSYAGKSRGVDEAGAFLYCSESVAYLFVQSDAPVELLFLSYGSACVDTVAIGTWQCPIDSMVTMDTRIGADGIGCQLTAERYNSGFSSTDTLYFISLTCDTPISRVSPLAVVLRGADADASIRTYPPAQLTTADADERWNAAEASHNIHAPAMFNDIIAVGATIHRTGFTNYLGTYYDYSQDGRNDGVRSYYSSVGPTMDGRIKPDVTAPGDNVVSSYSSFYEESNPTAGDILSDVTHFSFDGRTYAWNSNTGTSMAAPVVAGTIALWLQAKPDLTPDEALAVIAATSRKPETELSYPNNSYGYGEIDAYHGLLAVLGIEDAIEDISTYQPKAVSITPAHGSCLLLEFSAMPTCPLSVCVYSVSGAKIYATTLQLGQIDATNRATIQLPPLLDGVYAVQVCSSEKAFQGSTLVRMSK